MEKDVVLKELASLETQLSSLRIQIDCLTSELEEQREKVNTLMSVLTHSLVYNFHAANISFAGYFYKK